jgi:hypothetical protein
VSLFVDRASLGLGSSDLARLWNNGVVSMLTGFASIASVLLDAVDLVLNTLGVVGGVIMASRSLDARSFREISNAVFRRALDERDLAVFRLHLSFTSRALETSKLGLNSNGVLARAASSCRSTLCRGLACRPLGSLQLTINRALDDRASLAADNPLFKVLSLTLLTIVFGVDGDLERFFNFSLSCSTLVLLAN